jgi:hypothetical protein
MLRLGANCSFVSSLIFLGVFGACLCCHAQTADEVLKKCQYLELQSSYSATVENLAPRSTVMGRGGRLVIEQKVFGRQNGDGTKQMRVETTTSIQAPAAVLKGRKPPTSSNVSITTASGQIWQLYPDTKDAVQLSFVKDAMKTATTVFGSTAQGDSALIEGAKNELSDETVDGQTCFKLTQVFSQDVIEKQLDMWKSPQFVAIKQNAAQRIIAKRELWARKSDYLVIQTAMYDTDGNLMGGQKYTDITINPSLSADLFEIPKDYKTITADSVGELAKYIQTKMVDPTTGIRASDLPSADHRTTRRGFVIILLVLTVVPASTVICFKRHKS